MVGIECGEAGEVLGQKAGAGRVGSFWLESGPIAPPPPKGLTADEFREFREKLGATQVEMAQALGVTSRAVVYWEAGRPIPGPVLAWIWRVIEDMDDPPEFARRR